MYKIKMIYELHSTAENYRIRGIITGEYGEKRFIDRPVHSKGMRNFYKRSGGWMRQTRSANLTSCQYRKLFD